MQNQAKLIVKYQEIDKKLKMIEDELNGSEEAKKFFTARKFLQTVKDKLAELDQKAKVATDSYNLAFNEVKNLEKQIKDSDFAEFDEFLDESAEEDLRLLLDEEDE